MTSHKANRAKLHEIAHSFSSKHRSCLAQYDITTQTTDHNMLVIGSWIQRTTNHKANEEQAHNVTGSFTNACASNMTSRGWLEG